MVSDTIRMLDYYAYGVSDPKARLKVWPNGSSLNKHHVEWMN